MTPYNIAFLFCRLLSIWCVARFAELFAQGVSTAISYEAARRIPATPNSVVLFYVAWPLGLIAVACVLWIGAPLIARSVASNIEYSNYQLNENRVLQKLMPIGQGLLGWYFVVAGVAFFVGAVTSLAFGSIAGSFQAFEAQDRGNVVSSLLQIILGVFLLAFARRALQREADSTSSQDANQTGSL